MNRDVAILGGVRTPFCRRGGQLSSVPATDLAALVVRDVVLRSGVSGGDVELVVAGSSGAAMGPAFASEVSWMAGLSVRAFGVCAGSLSGEHAIAAAADAIALGRCSLAVAVGVDTPSELKVGLSQPLREAVTSTRLADSAAGKIRAWAGLRAADLKPAATPELDPISAESLAAAAEGVALRFGIGRDLQDRTASQSHAHALKAWQSDLIEHRLVVVPRFGARDLGRASGAAPVEIVTRDDGPSAGANDRRFAQDSPLAGRDAGSRVPAAVATVTQSNLARRADGAAAVLLASPELASQLGRPVLATLRTVAFGQVDPWTHPFMGGIAALEAGLRELQLLVSQYSVVEMSEASAATHLASIRGIDGLASRAVNAWGGALAYGRCPGADGVRMLIHAVDRLAADGGGRGVVISSGEAGLGAALFLD